MASKSLSLFWKNVHQHVFRIKKCMQEIILITNANLNQEFPKKKFKISHKNISHEFILSLYLKEVSEFAVHVRLGSQPIPHRFSLNICYNNIPLPPNSHHNSASALPHLTLDYHHPHYPQSWLHL